MYWTACTEGAHMGPRMPGPIPCASVSCSERWLGTQRGQRLWWLQLEEPPAPRWPQLPDTPSRGAEQSRGGSLVTARALPGYSHPWVLAGTGWMRLSPRRGGRAGGWCHYAPKWLWARCLTRGGGLEKLLEMCSQPWHVS